MVEIANQGDDADDEGHQEKDYADTGYEGQGHGGKREHRVCAETPETAEIPLALAKLTLFHHERQLVTLVAQPGAQAAKESVVLAQAVPGIHDFTIQKLEVGGIVHVNAAHFAEDPVEGTRYCLVKQIFFAARSLDAFHDIIALLLPQANHLRNVARRVLQVAVHEDSDIALHGFHGCADCGFFAKIPRKTDSVNSRVATGFVA